MAEFEFDSNELMNAACACERVVDAPDVDAGDEFLPFAAAAEVAPAAAVAEGGAPAAAAAAW
jgi:hypothetical protein